MSIIQFVKLLNELYPCQEDRATEKERRTVSSMRSNSSKVYEILGSPSRALNVYILGIIYPCNTSPTSLFKSKYMLYVGEFQVFEQA